MKSIYTCRTCGSTHIIIEVVDFCADCRSYNLGMKLPNRHFEEDTEEFKEAEKKWLLKQEEEQKQRAINLENDILNNIKNKDNILKNINWFYQWFDVMEKEVSSFRFNSKHEPLNEKLRNYWACGIPEIRSKIKNEDKNFLKTNVINDKYKFLLNYFQRIEDFIRKEYAETGLIDISSFEEKLKEVKLLKQF